MKKCKYCQTEIDEKAKICPNCKKKQHKFPVWLRILIGIIIVIIGIALLSNDIDNNDNSDKNDNSNYVTLEKFNQIENGMTYDEVKQIIGSDGTLSTEAGSGEYNTKIYYWYGEDNISNATISFTNDQVTAKSQIGLE